MKIPTVVEVIRQSAVTRFVRYEDRQLWYAANEGSGHPLCVSVFEFPVPIDDADGATFLAEDKTIFFMRWIRKHVAFLNAAITEEQSFPIPARDEETP